MVTWFTAEEGRKMRDLITIAQFIRGVEGMREVRVIEGDFIRVD